MPERRAGSMDKLTIVVPIYKNERNIRPFYEDFKENIRPFLDDYEIIMVNDDSPDGSWDMMLELAAEDSRIKLVRLSRNFGAIAASFTGIRYSSGNCVTVKACDLQEPPELTIRMYEEWKRGAKSVIAVREGRDDPALTRFFSAVYYWLMRTLVVKGMPKGGFDTYLIDRQVADYIISVNDRNSPVTLQVLWMGFGPRQVFYKRKKREIGKSSWTFSKKMKLFVDSLIGFSYVPVRMMSAVGIVCFLASIVWGIFLAAARLKGEIVVQGYTTILVMLLFSSGLIMFTLGLLGEYVWRTLDAARRRPVSIVSGTVNMEEDK